MMNILTDPVIPVNLSGGDRTRPKDLTLPQVFTALQADRVESFADLLTHQRQAWYQFLAQVGAIASSRATPATEAAWMTALERMAGEAADTAWRLHTPDPEEPAFFQPPTRRISDYKKVWTTPDEMDVLVTSKNHELKMACLTGVAPHFWLYTLLTLQTTQGYSGSRNHGIARMNGGLGSRVLVDRRPGPRWGPRVVRAIKMAAAHRAKAFTRGHSPPYKRGGLTLQWLRSWDDDDQIEIHELDPCFVEICRRVRLISGPDGGLLAVGRSSALPRTDAKTLNGNLGDPWAPVSKQNGKTSALTVGTGGFTYRLAQQILFNRERFDPAPAVAPLEGETASDAEIHMAVLVRGQGRTDGIHERVIPLPAGPGSAVDLTSTDECAGYSESSLAMVDLAAEVRKTVRYHVARHQHLSHKTLSDLKSANQASTAYDAAVDRAFFPDLFAAGGDPAAANTRWQKTLRGIATTIMRDHAWRRSTGDRRIHQADHTKTSLSFWRSLRRRLPAAFENSNTETAANHKSEER